MQSFSDVEWECPVFHTVTWSYIQVRRLGAELDASVFSVKAKNKLRARLAVLVQKVNSTAPYVLLVVRRGCFTALPFLRRPFPGVDDTQGSCAYYLDFHLKRGVVADETNDRAHRKRPLPFCSVCYAEAMLTRTVFGLVFAAHIRPKH